jgi:hypothetical protein
MLLMAALTCGASMKVTEPERNVSSYPEAAISSVEPKVRV